MSRGFLLLEAGTELFPYPHFLVAALAPGKDCPTSKSKEDNACQSKKTRPTSADLPLRMRSRRETQEECLFAQTRPFNIGLWVLAATILGSSMAFIDGTVV